MASNDFDIKLNELSSSIQELPEVRQFYELRQTILADPVLMRLDRLKRFHQRQMATSMHLEQSYQKHKRLYQTYESKYDRHPLVVNYMQVRETVYQLLQQIKAIIE